MHVIILLNKLYNYDLFTNEKRLVFLYLRKKKQKTIQLSTSAISPLSWPVLKHFFGERATASAPPLNFQLKKIRVLLILFSVIDY